MAARAHAHAAFDARFHEAHPLFWPIARAAAAFADERDWPAVGTYARAFAFTEVDPPVRFEAAAPRVRRRSGEVDRASLYDARIVRDRCVPTRPRSWHDFLNALVWATFPRAKRALHERQHRALAERIPAGARTLPSTRSREHDALALVDEGGVVVFDDGSAHTLVVFGHAVYESLVLRRGPVTACALRARLDALPPGGPVASAADALLASHLSGGTLDPSQLSRVQIRAASNEPPGLVRL